MSDADITAQRLCSLADQYRLSAEGIIEKCLVSAKSAAQNSGMKEVMTAFNSHAVTDQELEAAASQLRSRGFTVTSLRSGAWLQVTVKFDVCG